MKKSQRYYLSMIAVLNSEEINVKDKLEIIETLIDNKTVAEFTERTEEQE